MNSVISKWRSGQALRALLLRGTSLALLIERRTWRDRPCSGAIPAIGFGHKSHRVIQFDHSIVLFNLVIESSCYLI